MKILMLCPMLSSSSFITTYPYAKILSKHHDVKIVGPSFGKEVYVRDDSLNVEFIEPKVRKPIQLGMMSLFSKNVKRLMQGDYDVVHAFKLLPHTSPAAALVKKRLNKRFVLTVDDYDAAGGGKNPLKKYFLRKAEQSYKSADAIFVSSRFLQSKYGGEIIYQVANENIFLNNEDDGSDFRTKMGLENKIIILYAGSLYEQKGVDVLIKAVQKLKRDDVKLVIAGGTLGNKELQHYKSMAGEETIFIGQAPIDEIPSLVAACDIYAIPTKDTLYTRAEIPGKIFEPMMMGKAIVASNLSDIPLILDNGNAGLLSQPNSVDDLAEKLSKLVEDENLRLKLGEEAKKRYLENYSYEQMEKKILKVYEGLQ
jgi:glycosyltransferase involved in cell wall biosynthesis